MEIIEVRIIQGSGKAIEVNPYGLEPKKSHCLSDIYKDNFHVVLKKWHEAESKLREFDFVNDFRDYGSSYDIKINGDWEGFSFEEKINTHKAKILEDGKISIL